MKVATKDGTIELTNPQPDPLVWPVCAKCDTPYVLRRVLSIVEGPNWAWARDCAKQRSTCKNVGAVMCDRAGELPPGGR